MASSSNPLDRAEQIIQSVHAVGLVPVCGDQGCGATSGPRTLNLASGNMVAQLHPPSGGRLDPQPNLTYNSLSTVETAFGYGWSNMYGQKVTEIDSMTADLTKGTGTVFRYTNKDLNGVYTPPAGAKNALKKNADGTWTETQPDGLQLRYATTGRLARLQNASGSRWTLNYDAGGRVSNIVDPASRRTTLAYNASGKVLRIQDSGARITSFTVDANNNLVKVTSPELCVTSLVYDSVHRLKAWANPEGDRTTYGYDSSSRLRLMVSPKGERTTFGYPSSAARTVTTPRGKVNTILLTRCGCRTPWGRSRQRFTKVLARYARRSIRSGTGIRSAMTPLVSRWSRSMRWGAGPRRCMTPQVNMQQQLLP